MTADCFGSRHLPCGASICYLSCYPRAAQPVRFWYTAIHEKNRPVAAARAGRDRAGVSGLGAKALRGESFLNASIEQVRCRLGMLLQRESWQAGKMIYDFNIPGGPIIPY